MPELPEVETICRELKQTILGQKIEIIEVFKESSFQNLTRFKPEEFYQTILNIQRHGKYIDIELENKKHIIIHLRMTGKLIYTRDISETDKYTRVRIGMEQKGYLLFHDVRTFGKINLVNRAEDIQSLKELGIEPLTDSFEGEYLFSLCKDRRSSIKALLLNQKIIAGLGNIYVQEALFDSFINPERSSSELNEKECERLVASIKKILLKAIECNGTTISDFRRVDDKKGEFQNFLEVYGKKICISCGHELKVIKQSGRTTRYCTYCQS